MGGKGREGEREGGGKEEKTRAVFRLLGTARQSRPKLSEGEPLVLHPLPLGAAAAEGRRTFFFFRLSPLPPPPPPTRSPAPNSPPLFLVMGHQCRSRSTDIRYPCFTFYISTSSISSPRANN